MGEIGEERPVRRKIGRRGFVRGAVIAGLAAVGAGIKGSVPLSPIKNGTASGEAASQASLAAWKSELQALRQEGKFNAQGRLESSVIAASLEDINKRLPSLEDKQAVYKEVTRSNSPGPCESDTVGGSASVIVENFLLGVSLGSQRQEQEIDPQNIEIYDTSEATAHRLEELSRRVGAPKQVRVVEEPDGSRITIVTLNLFMPTPTTGGTIFSQAIWAGIQAVTQEPEPSASD